MSDLLAIGHVALDEFPGGAQRLGGTALYAAATAARLGLRAALVTRVGPSELPALREACDDLRIDLRALPAHVSTSFVFRWDDQGRRILRLRSRARGLHAADVPGDLASSRAVVLGSIAHELGEDLFATTAGSVRVLAAQGLLRRWDADGTVRPAPWERAEALIAGLSCVVLSEDDVGETAMIERWSARVPVMLTLAERGARLYLDGRVDSDLRAFAPSRIVDTTGAGDVFAAGLAVALAEGRTLREAGRFANAVASFGLEGDGTSALAPRAEVERRLGGLG